MGGGVSPHGAIVRTRIAPPGHRRGHPGRWCIDRAPFPDSRSGRAAKPPGDAVIMPAMSPSSAAHLTAVCLTLSLAGCQLVQRQPEAPPAPPPPPTIHEPVATHVFRIESTEDEVVGELQVTKVQGEDTLP